MKRNTSFSIIQELKADRESGLRSLYDEYAQSVYNIAYNVLKDQFESEDVVQEVFIKVWKARYDLDDNSNIWTFIFVISTRLSLNRLRNLKQKLKEERAIILHNTRVEVYCQNLDISELNQLEKVILNQLPGQQQKVYLLSRKEGKTYKEIAKLLNIAPNTVKNHLVQALKLFKKHLRKFGYFFLLFH